MSIIVVIENPSADYLELPEIKYVAYDNDQPQGPYGFGLTKNDAVRDLLIDTELE